MFSARNRLRAKKDINNVFTHGSKVYHPLVRLVVAPSPAKNTRTTVVVSRKVSTSAVVRNRVKRRLRAATQPFIEKMHNPKDIIVIAQPQAASVDQAELSKALDVLFSKHKLYE